MTNIVLNDNHSNASQFMCIIWCESVLPSRGTGIRLGLYYDCFIDFTRIVLGGYYDCTSMLLGLYYDVARIGLGF